MLITTTGTLTTKLEKGPFASLGRFVSPKKCLLELLMVGEMNMQFCLVELS